MLSRREAIQFAIQNEIKSQNLYKMMAKAFRKSDSGETFKNLVPLEKIHEEKLVELYHKEFPYNNLEIDRDIVPKADRTMKFDEPRSTIMFAQQRENEAKENYLELKRTSKDPKVKELFSQLAKEEEDHHQLLQNMIDQMEGTMMWFDESELDGLMEY
ncbi:MAG: ferritin family protein [Candidatus Cloacimonadota bacterium]|nr:ferritin family protein [Candidatus Cloacimonadota bacterium]